MMTTQHGYGDYQTANLEGQTASASPVRLVVVLMELFFMILMIQIITVTPQVHL